MSRALCIIDMQKKFEAATDPYTVRGVCAQIKRAKRYAWPVFLLEYCHDADENRHQPSLPAIRTLLKGHKHHRIIKYDDDGSSYVIAAATKHEIDLNIIRVCGVNAPYCVHDTVDGLLEKIPYLKVELVHKGCNACCSDRDGVLDDLKRIKGRRRNVRII